MKFQTVPCDLTPVALFRLVAAGWFFGAGLLVGLPLIVIGIFMTVSGHSSNDQQLWLIALLLPVILAGQSIVVGCIISFGLWFYRRLATIRVVQS